MKKSLVEKKIDMESGEHPYPVYYRLKDVDIKSSSRVGKNSLTSHLQETCTKLVGEINDPSWYFNYLNVMLNLEYIKWLKNYFDGIINEEAFNQAFDYFVIDVF